MRSGCKRLGSKTKPGAGQGRRVFEALNQALAQRVQEGRIARAQGRQRGVDETLPDQALPAAVEALDPRYPPPTRLRTPEDVTHPIWNQLDHDVAGWPDPSVRDMSFFLKGVMSSNSCSARPCEHFSSQRLLASCPCLGLPPRT